jgi:proline iminopeptidase
MKKKTLVGMLALLGLVVVAGVLLWYFTERPLHEPGMVHGGKNLRASLSPPKQASDANSWNAEKDISPFHFSDGTGKSVLVVHGRPGYPIHNPLPGLRLLSAKYKFIYYDQRGCGKSTRPFDRFSSSNFFENAKVLDRTLGLGAHVADMERIRRIIGEEKVILLGHSFGAFLVSLYAAEFPQNIEVLILVAPANVLVIPAEGGGLFEDIRKLLPDAMQQEYADYLKHLLDYGNLFSKSEAELAALNAEFARYYRAAAASPSRSSRRNLPPW